MNLRPLSLRALLALATLLCSTAVMAQDAAPVEFDEPPPPPDPMISGQPMELEPQVTIVRRDDATIEEYRINGHLYLVKVKPVVGPVYYLMDSDGNGSMDQRMSQLYDEPIIPKWVLFSW